MNKKDKQMPGQPTPPDANVAPVIDINNVSAVTLPAPKLSEVDKMALDLAKERRLTALAEAKTAMAKNENAELSFKYTVLQIYMKYSLNQDDAISEDGTIIKGGALQRQQQNNQQ